MKSKARVTLSLTVLAWRIVTRDRKCLGSCSVLPPRSHAVTYAPKVEEMAFQTGWLRYFSGFCTHDEWSLNNRPRWLVRMIEARHWWTVLCFRQQRLNFQREHSSSSATDSRYIEHSKTKTSNFPQYSTIFAILFYFLNQLMIAQSTPAKPKHWIIAFSRFRKMEQ